MKQHVEQIAVLTFGVIIFGMRLAYCTGKEHAFRIATKNGAENLNTILAAMSPESAKEFIDTFKSVM